MAVAVWKLTRVLLVFVIYSFFITAALFALRKQYFFYNGILPFPNGTYLVRDYRWTGRYVYSLYRLRDDKLLAWNIGEMCFNDRAVAISFYSKKDRPAEADYEYDWIGRVVYVDAESVAPKTEEEYFHVEPSVGLSEGGNSCAKGFCGSWFGPELLLDFQHRNHLEPRCGPLPAWLEWRDQERPRP